MQEKEKRKERRKGVGPERWARMKREVRKKERNKDEKKEGGKERRRGRKGKKRGRRMWWAGPGPKERKKKK